MNRYLLFSALLFPCLAQAMSCGPEETLQQRFEKADSVLAIQIVSTELKNMKFHDDEIGISIATYQLVESFKGSEEAQGKVIELIGYGTGMVGLIPGIYYFVILGGNNGSFDFPLVHMCNTLGSTMNIEGTESLKKLEELRALK